MGISLRLGGAVMGAMLLCAPAQAANTTLKVRAEKARSCTAKLVAPGSAGVAHTRATAPGLGYFQAKLTAARGDWDVGVFDARTGRGVAGSAAFGSTEVAGGYVRPRQKLVVQACRRDSDSARARVSTSFTALKVSKERPKMVRVATPLGNEAARMIQLGLDVTEHGGPGFMDVVVHNASDEQLLRAAGLEFKVLVHDLKAVSDAALRQDRANYGERSALPSGRSTYRLLEDYQNDMKALVAAHPGLARAITLPEPSLEGRPVEGIEIASDVHSKTDGRPVFLMVGVHHAREWPSSEHTMEWAFELLDGYGKSADVTRLVDNVRTILVPVVNVDGFNLSVNKTRVGTTTSTHEYKRKNCRVTDGQVPGVGQCAASPASRGVDPNRNYGGLWGGVGASTSTTSETYRGAGPFSEPETRNIQWLVSNRQVTNLITNHTHGGLVLRPPGVAAQGWSPDEAAMKDLGDRMASHNGYTSQYGWQLYDTNGTTEDWSYTATGGYGYTFEIGTGGNFHLAYQDHVVNEYLGAGNARGAGRGGNRAAYFAAMEETADTAHHGVLVGKNTTGPRVLELSKSFQTSTASVLNTSGVPTGVTKFDDKVASVLEVPAQKGFEWHVNPSTRPEVRGGRWQAGEPTEDFALTAPPVPTVPSVGAQTALSRVDYPFTVAAGEDNGYMRARIDWTAADNWDLEFYRVNADDSLTQIAKSINSTTSSRKFEELQSVHVTPGDYLIRVRNVQATGAFPTGKVEFFSPEPPEAYTLTCKDRDGNVLRTQQVYVTRGERVDVGDPCRKPKS